MEYYTLPGTFCANFPANSHVFLNLMNIFRGFRNSLMLNPSFLLVNQPPWIKIPFMLPTVAVIPVTLGSKVAWFWGEWFFPTFNRESLLNGLI